MPFPGLYYVLCPTQHDPDWPTSMVTYCNLTHARSTVIRRMLRAFICDVRIERLRSLLYTVYLADENLSLVARHTDGENPLDVID